MEINTESKGVKKLGKPPEVRSGGLMRSIWEDSESIGLPFGLELRHAIKSKSIADQFVANNKTRSLIRLYFVSSMPLLRAAASSTNFKET